MALPQSKAQAAVVAMQRFGLGPRRGIIARVARNPLDALVNEVQTAGIARITDSNLPGYARACDQSQRGFTNAEDIRRAELEARIDKQRSVEIGFVERLVLFWSNHFSMSVNKSGAVRGTIGQLERDVIRKHVLGRFSDMLLGVMKHPAMISFLDNEDSVGPRSEFGEPRGRGTNENLAREALELHTLGSGGGYTEADVAAFALILSGWSYVRSWEAENNYYGGNRRNRGRFIFRPAWHEPGAISFMGRSYPPKGLGQGIEALRRLALSPATAEHIAFKLVRHFITDEPTPEMVEPLKKRFLDTKGDLKQVALALIRLPDAFSAPMTKIRTPYELGVAQLRALGRRYDDDSYWSFHGPLHEMNHVPWQCPSPQGYSDDTPKWLEPDGMTLRVDTAQMMGWVYDDTFRGNVAKLARDLYASALSQASYERIEAAGSTSAALTILFCSPEFQRR